MTFESHKVVKEYMNELAKITEAREQLKSRLVEVREKFYQTDDDETRKWLHKSAEDLERQVSALTSKGQGFMLKVDQLNGVR